MRDFKTGEIFSADHITSRLLGICDGLIHGYKPSQTSEVILDISGAPIYEYDSAKNQFSAVRHLSWVTNTANNTNDTNPDNLLAYQTKEVIQSRNYSDADFNLAPHARWSAEISLIYNGTPNYDKLWPVEYGPGTEFHDLMGSGKVDLTKLADNMEQLVAKPNIGDKNDNKFYIYENPEDIPIDTDDGSIVYIKSFKNFYEARTPVNYGLQVLARFHNINLSDIHEIYGSELPSPWHYRSNQYIYYSDGDDANIYEYNDTGFTPLPIVYLNSEPDGDDYIPFNFDPQQYINSSPDLVKAANTLWASDRLGGATSHWKNHGYREREFGRRFSLWYDGMDKMELFPMRQDIHLFKNSVSPERYSVIASPYSKTLPGLKDSKYNYGRDLVIQSYPRQFADVAYEWEELYGNDITSELLARSDQFYTRLVSEPLPDEYRKNIAEISPHEKVCIGYDLYSIPDEDIVVTEKRKVDLGVESAGLPLSITDPYLPYSEIFKSRKRTEGRPSNPTEYIQFNGLDKRSSVIASQKYTKLDPAFDEKMSYNRQNADWPEYKNGSYIKIKGFAERLKTEVNNIVEKLLSLDPIITSDYNGKLEYTYNKDDPKTDNNIIDEYSYTQVAKTTYTRPIYQGTATAKQNINSIGLYILMNTWPLGIAILNHILDPSSGYVSKHYDSSGDLDLGYISEQVLRDHVGHSFMFNKKFMNFIPSREFTVTKLINVITDANTEAVVTLGPMSYQAKLKEIITTQTSYTLPSIYDLFITVGIGIYNDDLLATSTTTSPVIVSEDPGFDEHDPDLQFTYESNIPYDSIPNIVTEIDTKTSISTVEGKNVIDKTIKGLLEDIIKESEEGEPSTEYELLIDSISPYNRPFYEDSLTSDKGVFIDNESNEYPHPALFRVPDSDSGSTASSATKFTKYGLLREYVKYRRYYTEATDLIKIIEEFVSLSLSAVHAEDRPENMHYDHSSVDKTRYFHTDRQFTETNNIVGEDEDNWDTLNHLDLYTVLSIKEYNEENGLVTLSKKIPAAYVKNGQEVHRPIDKIHISKIKHIYSTFGSRLYSSGMNMTAGTYPFIQIENAYVPQYYDECKFEFIEREHQAPTSKSSYDISFENTTDLPSNITIVPKGLFTDPRTAILCTRHSRSGFQGYNNSAYSGTQYHPVNCIGDGCAFDNPYYAQETFFSRIPRYYINPKGKALYKQIRSLTFSDLSYEKKIFRAIENSEFIAFEELVEKEALFNDVFFRQNTHVNYYLVTPKRTELSGGGGVRYSTDAVDHLMYQIDPIHSATYSPNTALLLKALVKGVENLGRRDLIDREDYMDVYKLNFLRIFTKLCIITRVPTSFIAAFLSVSASRSVGDDYSTLDIEAPIGYEICKYFTSLGKYSRDSDQERVDTVYKDRVSSSMLAAMERIAIHVGFEHFEGNTLPSATVPPQLTLDYSKIFANTWTVDAIKTESGTPISMGSPVNSINLTNDPLNPEFKRFNDLFKANINNSHISAPIYSLFMSVAGIPSTVDDGDHIKYTYETRLPKHMSSLFVVNNSGKATVNLNRDETTYDELLDKILHREETFSPSRFKKNNPGHHLDYFASLFHGLGAITGPLLSSENIAAINVIIDAP